MNGGVEDRKTRGHCEGVEGSMDKTGGKSSWTRLNGIIRGVTLPETRWKWQGNKMEMEKDGERERERARSLIGGAN